MLLKKYHDVLTGKNSRSIKLDLFVVVWSEKKEIVEVKSNNRKKFVDETQDTRILSASCSNFKIKIDVKFKINYPFFLFYSSSYSSSG